MEDLNKALLSSSTWPVQCVNKLLKRLSNKLPERGYVLFETGYGPSGLPHIGTFGEVVRTKFVQHTLEMITGFRTKLIVTSDDYDGMRKIPTNLPNQEMLSENIDRPLTQIPDPFGTHNSFGEHMNSRLKSFLDSFGFEYEFKSATELYKNGEFNDALLQALRNYDKIMNVMLPTLGEERQKTYSPFLPICYKTGRVLYLKTNPENIEKGTISYLDPQTGDKVETSVLDGNCKLQWKPDFGVRWAALDVDFEMYGKDHLANGPIYSKICKIVGGKPPEQYVYELFLDKDGQKISKSKGNEDVPIDKWLKYAPTESLSLFMFQNPHRAKKLYFDVIPKNVDEYLEFVRRYHEEDLEKKVKNPVFYIHQGKVPEIETFGISFSLLLNIASACNASSKEVLWGFIKAYNSEASPENAKFLDDLVGHAVNYYEDFVKNSKQYRIPKASEVKMLEKIKSKLDDIKNEKLTSQELQSIFYEVGRESGIKNMKDYFKALYQILLGQEQGPRLGSFVSLFGIDESIKLIDQAIER